MAEFERIEKDSYLRIFTHNINKRKFMISCCVRNALMAFHCVCQVLYRYKTRRLRIKIL